MGAEDADTVAARQTALAVARLDSLLTLPCVAIQYFSKFLQSRFSPSDLADIVESDPALAAKIFSLSHQHGVNLPSLKFSLRLALDRLPADLVRQAILSVRVLAASELEHDPDNVTMPPAKELVLHSLAVACCAKDIAAIITDKIGPELAYYAGLLHDIGKFALQETMPKSLAQIVEEAKSTGASSYTVEQRHLGTSHTLLGKSLAQKWHLPEPISLAIWLHHSDAVTISRDVPEAKIAQLVRSADSIARRAGIGHSGSFDLPEPTEKIAQSLGVTVEQLDQIRVKLLEAVKAKSRVLGLDLPNATARYCQFAHTAAGRFAQQQAELSVENRRLGTACSHFDFITDFLLSISSDATAIDVAENFAVRWQKFYQTGLVCLYLAPTSSPESLEAAVVESLGQSRTIILNVSSDAKPIPETVANRFAILDAQDHVDWLLEQLELESDLRQAKLVPLLSDGKAVGALVFEMHYPADAELFEENFGKVAGIAGVVLDMVLGRHKYERFAELFARLIHGAAEQAAAPPLKAEVAPAEIAADASLEALAEMTAGVAHELNNPLSVISGRAQLLADAETDQKKKRALQQIQENAREASAIMGDLMSFAEPPPPKPSRTDVKQMIDEAVQLTRQKTGAEHINVQIQAAEDVKSVFVDSAQVVSALANVVSNSLESYRDPRFRGDKLAPAQAGVGPIKITADAAGSRVRLQVKDLGCGMDAETLRKATHPFFSAKPAGRKRGMGLAYTARTVQLNKGSLSIESEPGKGTTVTIYLPVNYLTNA
jgi:putative nucleotidyltransferase with HDIG domain